ncbi:methionyl-tRNA synthetase [Aulographum hederae CBS 113979]|uniref:methionine--tRNA ligase n=1 Tax=Aulographum hederae CBS 113979 TaxID=1176131 RepID=A0A6G1H4B2_9PEZI|nr:methionyl-tRNA synthetase [Aulographum hederae CBS 113979]
MVEALSSVPTQVLPRNGQRNVLITSALPDVNNVPHLGNIIGSLLSADVFARYCRERGLNTLYVCTDEYGTTTEARALIENVTPQELCDNYHTIHANVYKWFNISFDIFGRTNTKLQTSITQDIFLKLHQNGFLQERLTTQLYCQKHSAFLADRFVEGDCPVCNSSGARGDQCDFCGTILDSLDLKNPQKHIFIELDQLQPEIDTFFQKSVAKGAWSENGKDITSAWLKECLQPRYEAKVIYPWFDACIGYVSITACHTDQWRQWWQNPDNVELYQFIGKDNVIFHSVMFPGTQIGTQEPWTKIHHLSTTDYLTYEGGKFSKSRGIGVFGDSAQNTGVPSDVWRYYLLSHRPETGDTEFNWDSFISANNNVLLKNLGNFLRHEIAVVLQISQLGNGFLQTNKLDNKLAENEPSKCASVIGLAINLIHLLAALITPYMPDTAVSIYKQLRADPLPIPDRWNADSIKAGHEIGKAEYLFSKIKEENGKQWRELFGSEEARKFREEEAIKKAKKKMAKKAREVERAVVPGKLSEGSQS